jgi:hypothetical protein
MATKDIQSITKFKAATNNEVFGVNGAINGFSIDTQDFNSLSFQLTSHTYAGGTFTATVIESDDNVNFTDTDAKFITGSAVLTAATSETSDPKTLGYVGKKRYVKLRVTATNIAGGNGATINGYVLLSDPKEAPVV